MRLVPETVKFTLYNADKSEVLVADLRDVTNPWYEFTYSENDNYFILEATQVSDTKEPEFSFVITQNPYTPQDATIYTIPSEPVASISATIGSADAELKELQSPPYVYYQKAQLTGSGTIQISVTAIDISGNSGTGAVTLTYGLAKPTEATTITDEVNGIALEIPREAVSVNKPVVFTRCEMGLDYNTGTTPVGSPIYIGPQNTYFSKTVVLKIPTDNAETSLYRLNGKTWEFVAPYSRSIKIDRTGTYQLFAKSATEPVKTAVPRRFKLYAAYPNPFNNTTIIRYDIERPGNVSLIIYDLQGREVRTLTHQRQLPGSYSIPWNGKNNDGQLVASGSYIFRFSVKDGKSTLYKRNQKITLVK
jgi:hypothetical protein